MKNKLYDHLKARGMTQRDLARKLHTDDSTISKYVWGETIPSLWRAYEISHALGVTVEDIWETDECS